MTIRGYKEAHTNLNIWGWEDTSMKGNTSESEDMRKQGYQQASMNLELWGCEDARTRENTHKSGNMT